MKLSKKQKALLAVSSLLLFGIAIAARRRASE